MFQQTFKGLLFFLAVFVLSSTSAIAAGSGAFRVELPDAGPMGMGSAFVGEADRASAVYYNPAGMTQIENNQVSIGAALVDINTEHTGPSGTETESKAESRLVPHFYAVSDFGLDDFAFGVSAGSHFGLVTEWADDSFARYNATRSEILTQDYKLTAAYQLTDQWSFAVSADYNRMDVDKRKRLLQTGGNDGLFRLHGDSDAWGYRLATHFKLNEQHSFGLMYRSSKQHKVEGQVELSQLNGSGSNYQAIFGGTNFKTPVEIKSELPQSVVAGYSYKPSDKWTFNFDVEWMDWSSIRDELLTYPEDGSFTANQRAVLNTDNPIYHDWDSVFSFGLGTEYKATDKLRLRTGYFYHETPIPDDTFEANLPDSDSHTFTAGFGYDLRKDLILDMTYSGMYFEERVIDNDVGANFGADLDGTYEQWVNLFLATLTYNF